MNPSTIESNKKGLNLKFESPLSFSNILSNTKKREKNRLSLETMSADKAFRE
jgi:hypothetical protein